MTHVRRQPFAFFSREEKSSCVVAVRDSERRQKWKTEIKEMKQKRVPSGKGNICGAPYAHTVPLQTHVKDFYTPFFLCTEVVREGSRRFEGVEPLGGTLHTLLPLCR